MSDMTDLSGKTVLVTGASRGLGREMALELCTAGADVILHGSADTPALRATLDDALALRAGRAMALSCDIADAAACAALLERAEAAFGPLDVLVNNAGLGMRSVSETYNTVPVPFWQVPAGAWQAILATNLGGPFNMARAAAPGMIARGGGKIVNISTSDITMVRRGYSPYGAGKAALEAASRAWAQDLGGTGVTVNVYLPGGAADTDLLPPSPDKKGADGNLFPPAIMRRGIRWLCGPGSDGVTGARFIARLWDTALPPDIAAAGARDTPISRPRIM